MMKVRNSVKENRLTDPSIITEEMVLTYITERGKGWICEDDRELVAFGIVDMIDDNIWALFVNPETEGYGIGSALHDLLLKWFFAAKDGPLWLGTDPDTRAAEFYKNKGWVRTEMRENGELRFEMTREVYKNLINQDETE